MRCYGEETHKIRTRAGLIGLIMVAYSPRVENAVIHFKSIERDKIKSLKRSKGNFGENMWLSSEGIADIRWWQKNMDNSRQIRREDPHIELCRDASLQGWGMHTESSEMGQMAPR